MQVTTKQAIAALVNALETDSGYRAVWRANIAMCTIDVLARWGLTNKDVHLIANEAADEFLGILCLNSPEPSAPIAEKLAAVERGEPV